MASERVFTRDSDGSTVTTSVPAAATDLLARGFHEVLTEPEPKPVPVPGWPEETASVGAPQASKRRGSRDSTE